LRKGSNRRMSSGMKGRRDILVAGISFLFGMVFCYFLTAAKLSPSERGLVTFVYHGAVDGSTNAIDLKALKLNWN
jgi:hypothetical protein